MKTTKKLGSAKPILKMLLTLAALAVILTCIALGVYTVYLARKVDARFAGRRWNIPSTVYSDTTLLYPGQRINHALFEQKLKHLGYRSVPKLPMRKGEMRLTHNSANVFLHDFKSPILNQAGFLVRIRFDQNRIDAIINQQTGNTLPLLEIEPGELMRFYGPERERRRLVSIQTIPKHLINAVLAAEDDGFFHHRGVDVTGILRALLTNLRAGSIRQGGSTLTQQLAKNYFLTPERTYRRKLKELLTALIIEVKYAKEEILEIYLNEIYWGQKGSVSINGVAEAALFYFDKPAEDLTLVEAATLAGLIKGPNAYSPYSHAARCLKRRNAVLVAMHQNEWLDEAALKKALASPLKPVRYTTYRRQAPYFIDYLSHQITDLYPPDVLSTLGLTIYTTLDTQVQQAAEEALENGLTHLESIHPHLKRARPEDQLQGAIIVLHPKTGHILAMVGGRDYNLSQFNRATQARRQPGSAFKPIVYLTALSQLTPVDLLDNTPQSYPMGNGVWHPKNFDPDAPPEVTFRKALAQSQNLATINLALATGLESIAAKATAFELSPLIKPLPSIALGAFEVSPLNLARAYCVFAADGLLPFPLTMKVIQDDAQNIIERRHVTVKRLITSAEAYLINDLLRSVATEGTAVSLTARGIDWPTAGKTGTTNDSKDAWFVGYTPNIMALVWVGFDNGDSITSTGSRAALPIWAELMQKIPQYVSAEWFTLPAGVVELKVCEDSGKLALEKRCPRIRKEVFLESMQPDTPCPLHDAYQLKDLLKGVKNIFQAN